MKTVSFIAGLLAAAIVQPASAQEWLLSRRVFTFHDHNLTINVISDGSGTLQILRGEAGRVEVAARAPNGIPAFAMGGREGDELRLSAPGANPVDYVVVVPEDIRVRVRLPQRKQAEVASTRATANYSWGGEPRGGGLLDQPLTLRAGALTTSISALADRTPTDRLGRSVRGFRMAASFTATPRATV